MLMNPYITLYGVPAPKASINHLNLFRIITAIAVPTFNELELSLFGILTDLGLSLFWRTYTAFLKRDTGQIILDELRRSPIIKDEEEEPGNSSNKESSLLKVKGGRSYKGRQFGVENSQKEVSRLFDGSV
ncbi:hypothetical protein LOD99_5373 [Oopsacas minuta]|uniref:Uncharacterized protein n=1 Tax=Oopsacas minuta TaxID=111878 RepID=A0AAV7JRB2_9METZ|nr:hypothetical protein LOD99_5373 [Oopsacas minuta]